MAYSILIEHKYDFSGEGLEGRGETSATSISTGRSHARLPKREP